MLAQVGAAVVGAAVGADEFVGAAVGGEVRTVVTRGELDPVDLHLTCTVTSTSIISPYSLVDPCRQLVLKPHHCHSYKKTPNWMAPVLASTNS